MAFWRYSSLRLRRKEVINVFYTQSVSSFSTEEENGVGRGRGAPSLPSLESPPTGAGVDPGSRPAPVQGRGRKSRFAEELGLKFDPAKEEAKLKEYIPEESPHVSRYEDVEISSNKESKIRVVGNTQNQKDELNLQTLNRRKKRSEPKKVITALGKQQQRADSEDRQTQKEVKAEKHQKTETATESDSIRPEDQVSIEGVPEKPEEVVTEKKIPSLTKTAKSIPQPEAKTSLKAEDQVPAENKEIDWMTELTPKTKKKPSVESSWLDELGPGVKLQAASGVHGLTQAKPQKTETTASAASAQVLEGEVHYTPVHKAYQEEDETQPIAEQPVHEVVEEFIVEDKHSADGKILVQFEDEDLAEPPVSSEDSDDDIGEDEGGEGTDSAAEQSSIVESTNTKEEEEQASVQEEEQVSIQGEEQISIQGEEQISIQGEEQISIQGEEQISIQEEKLSSIQEMEDSSKEKIVSEAQWEAFEKYRQKPESEKVSSEVESGGLASLLQGLMKKDRKQLDSRSQSSGSLMQSLGWGSDQPDESQQPPQGAASPTQLQSDSQTRFAQPLQSALAERLGWTAPQARFIETFDVEEDFQQRYRRERSPRTRMVDAYGRLKARTPEERRQRAMRSGKAMEMALEGKLDEFDPDDYDEPELPEPELQVPQGRGRGRGRFRGRGRGRGMGRDVPNLFQQKPIEKTPSMKAAPHREEEYYEEDAMSKLGVKFSQHELMNMERYIQSLVSPSFNFKTDQPTPWIDLRRSSADQYLENHKSKVKDVMKASGFAFSDERWDQLKRNAIIDFASYKQQDSAKHKAIGESPLKSVKDEEESLQRFLESSLSADDPLHAHMEVALPMILANPTWAYSNKKKFVHKAQEFSQRRET